MEIPKNGDTVRVSISPTQTQNYQVIDVNSHIVIISPEGSTDRSIIFKDEFGNWKVYMAEHLPIQVDIVSSGLLSPRNLSPRDSLIDESQPRILTPCGEINADGKIIDNIYLVRKNLDHPIRFYFPIDIQNTYMEGKCGDLAYVLSKKMGPYWEIYSVILEHPELEDIHAHYILKTPGGMALDIVGLRPIEKVIDEWNNNPPRKAVIKPVRNQMDNPDYDKMICDKEGLKNAEEVADQILKILEEEYMLIKVITPITHPFKRLPSYSNVFTDELLLTRVSSNYRLLGDLGFGPKIFDQIVCEQVAVVYMQFLPIATTNELIAEHSDQIQQLINKLHSLGIYHGDLHGSNLAFTSTVTPKLIDADLVFYRDEIENNPIVSEWAEYGFDMSIDELIDWEMRENWKVVVEI